MKHTLLVVDDDRLILNTLKQRFSSWDITVYEAATAEQALQILSSVTPDAVLMDLLLTTDGGSRAVIDYMKRETRLQHVPIVVLTNMEHEEIKKILLTQGVNEYLVKGRVSLDELFLKVSSYLEMPRG